MAGVTYDTGALVAAERNDRRMWALHAGFLAEEVVRAVPAPVLAEAWRSATARDVRGRAHDRGAGTQRPPFAGPLASLAGYGWQASERASVMERLRVQSLSISPGMFERAARAARLPEYDAMQPRVDRQR